MRKNKYLLPTIPIVCFVFLLFSLMIYSQEYVEEQRLPVGKEKYPTTSLKYRGVVAMQHYDNWYNNDYLFCDFGSQGIWSYGGVGAPSWTKINNNDPEWIVAFQQGGIDYLLADFGSLGLWYWAGDGIWSEISNQNVEFAFAVDSDSDGFEEVFIDFGGTAIKKYDFFSLASIGNSYEATSGLAFNQYGAYDFGSDGLWYVECWIWHFFPFVDWYKINNHDPGDDNLSIDLGMGSYYDDLAVDFSSIGLWVYDLSSWTKINDHSLFDIRAAQLDGDSEYELVAGFIGVNGLWKWDNTGGSGTWTIINNHNATYDEAFCEPFFSDTMLAVDFGTLGLWIYDPSSGIWKKINNHSPRFMVAANLQGEIYQDECIVCDFGSLGLWYYNFDDSSWTKINNSSPDPN